MLQYTTLNLLTIITPWENRRTVQHLSKNMRSLFHTYKNLFFTIQGLSEQAMSNIKEDKELSYENLEYLHEIACDSVKHISRTLNMLGNIKQDTFYADIFECIDNAVSRVCIPKNIKIERLYLISEAMVKADESHLTDSFVNIIQNSIEAITIKNNNGGFIKIEVFEDDDLIVLNFLDNGCGINKSDKKRIFTLLFSTKQSTTNCGIGLNYVKNVITAFHGTIHVKSVEGDYTKLQITLPRKA